MVTQPQKLKLTRDQLASFLKDPEQIKQFEKLFAVTDTLATTDTDAFNIAIGTASTQAVQALDQIEALQRVALLAAMQPVARQDTSTATDYIDLPDFSPGVSQSRRLQWNVNDGTLDIGLYGGSVLQVGQETVYYAKNTSGATIPNGSTIMFTGVIGASGKITIGLAVANGSVSGQAMLGVATQDIANNAFGYVTAFGFVRGFDTSGTPYGEVWADGDGLYFSPTIPGGWTKVQPSAPAIATAVGVVINAAGGGAGTIHTRMDVSKRLVAVQDVQLTAPANGNLLIYDGVAALWKNALLTAGTGISITNGAASVTIALTATQVLNEVPSGAINGVNVTYTLAHTPTAAGIALFLNGLLQTPTTDYTLAAATITMVAAPLAGDVLLANYSY